MKIIYAKCGSKIIVDSEDYALLNRHAWIINSEGYARTALGDNYMFMHRLILAPKGNLYVDHKNRNRLDNRKRNLREATNSLNQLNRRTSSDPDIGVTWHAIAKKWTARVSRNGKEYYLGLHSDKQKAIETRKEFLLKKEF